jgi:hypothetical protein
MEGVSSIREKGHYMGHYIISQLPESPGIKLGEPSVF